MKKAFQFFIVSVLILAPALGLAHVAEEDPVGLHHEENDVAQVNPAVFAAAAGVIIAAGGFFVWRILLKKK